MTAQQFSCCSNTIQFEILRQAGVCLMKRRVRKTQTYLFSIDGFYVEVIQNRRNGDEFRLRSFDDVDQLDPYLSQIDISLVLNQ
ncbi:MAG TPA: hypothetical protein VD794_04120 [Flavisolibacter sp.]|nr:hypothetical protein [Flavisolibacter sp.]